MNRNLYVIDVLISNIKQVRKRLDVNSIKINEEYENQNKHPCFVSLPNIQDEDTGRQIREGKPLR